MLGRIESGFDTASLGANPTVAEVTEAIKKGRGRPRVYATQEEAAAAKKQQNK